MRERDDSVIKGGK